MFAKVCCMKVRCAHELKPGQVVSMQGWTFRGIPIRKGSIAIALGSCSFLLLHRGQSVIATVIQSGELTLVEEFESE